MSVQSIYSKLFGIYDIRGVFNRGLDVDFSYRLACALSRYISAHGKARFLVGHDARASSPVLANALMVGLIECGQVVDYVGLASTPRLYWQGAQENYDCSVAITASHLPAQHNGFKICQREAVPLSFENGLPELARLVAEARGNYKQQPVAAGKESSLTDYIERMASFAHFQKQLRIIVDCGGSPVGPELEQLAKHVNGVEFIGLGTTPDGTFAHRSANPLDEGALTELRSCIIDRGVHFGAAFDGDGDRIVVVDEVGEVVPPDLLTALVASRVLALQPGAAIMFDLRSSRTVPEFIEQLGGKAMQSRVGHSLIKADMRRQQVAFAGELSGHYYWADLFYTDNALRVLLELANFLSLQDKPLSELVKPLKKYAGSGEVNFRLTESEKVMKRLESEFSDGKQFHIDGLSVEYPSWWFNVRTSKTEPLLRLCMGASTADDLKTRLQQLSAIITTSAVDS